MSKTLELFESIQNNLNEEDNQEYYYEIGFTTGNNDGYTIYFKSNKGIKKRPAHIDIETIKNLAAEAGVFDNNKYKPELVYFGKQISKDEYLYRTTPPTPEEKERDEWWDKHYKEAIDFVNKVDPEYIIDMIYNGNEDMYYNQKAKYVALDLLYKLGVKDFEEEINNIEGE